MRLTQKDREFLETLKRLLESKDLRVEFVDGRPGYMVLRGTYGDHVHQAFRMSRQGVRWRFQRLFNEVYVNAFETILFIEKIFGPELRPHAIRISQERYTRHHEAYPAEFQSADRVQQP